MKNVVIAALLMSVALPIYADFPEGPLEQEPPAHAVRTPKAKEEVVPRAKISKRNRHLPQDVMTDSDGRCAHRMKSGITLFEYWPDATSSSGFSANCAICQFLMTPVWISAEQQRKAIEEAEKKR